MKCFYELCSKVNFGRKIWIWQRPVLKIRASVLDDWCSEVGEVLCLVG